MNAVKYEQALQRLAAYCSRGERCVQDILRKMIRWELPEQEQKRVILYLQKENFLNEQRFCRAFVHDKSKYNHWGAYKIRYELQKKQIPEACIREALSGIDKETNQQQLQQLLTAKRKTVTGKNEYEINQKLMRFAVGKGFLLEEIQTALGL
ncbi:MAG: RecX family transcriptional regulator [Dysgonamonadaceae bacterium]|jgi:regulatory protein|nr:RecX family transcriptional regulator [Dysgonamonadaceae bacterium]